MTSRCRYCHNPELQQELHQCDEEYKALLQEDDVLEDIYNLSKKITGVTVSGGEPLIWQDLELFLRKIKRMGLLVKLNTNGSHFYRLRDLIEKDLLTLLT